MPNGQETAGSVQFPIIFTNNEELPLIYTVGGVAHSIDGQKSVKVDTPCQLIEILKTARHVTEGTAEQPLQTRRAAIVQNTNATRLLIDKICKQAQKDNCPFTCEDLLWNVATVSESPKEQNIREDSGDVQGAPQSATGATVSPAIETSSDDNNPPGPQYAPLSEEEQKQPLSMPFSAEVSNETVEGGDPVDLYRGAFTIQEADLVVPGSVLPLALVRSYRSGHPFPGPFAWNWDHNHNIYLRELLPADGDITGDVARWNGDLREDIFAWNGEEFEPPRGVFQKLERLPFLDPDGEYVIHDVGGLSWFFGRPDGWTNIYRIPLVTVRDRFGNRLEYDYDDENRLNQVTCKPVDASGASASWPYHYLRFIYGNCGLLERVSDSLGREVDYYHDPDIQRLLRVRYPVAHPGDTNRMERTYSYGGLHLPETLRHNIIRVDDGHGNVYVENYYDEDPSSWSYGHVLRQMHGGYLYRFQYTPLQWLPSHDDYLNVPVQRTEVLDPEGGLTTYTFNFRGNILDRRTRLAKDGSFWITAVAFKYDTQGNRTESQQLRELSGLPGDVLQQLWGIGELRQYHHDHSDPRMRGLVKEIRRLDGAENELVWAGTYDPDTQLLETEYGLPGDGFSAADLTTTYQYSSDAKRTLVKIIHPPATLPDGTMQTAETSFETNQRGQTTAIITPEGIRHELVYQESVGLGRGRLLKKIADAGPGGVAAEQGFTYDGYGFLETVTDPSGAVVTYEYNALGQIEKVTAPEINGAAPTTLMRYNSDGLLVEVERPHGAYADSALQGDHIVDRSVRNILGYVVRSEIGANTETPRITSRVVDHRGLPLRSIDPVGTVSRWQWDERGLLFRHGVEGADKAVTGDRYIYERDGRLRREIHGPAGDDVTEYRYGLFGRIARVHTLHRSSDGSTYPAGPTLLHAWSGRGYLARTELREYPGDTADTLLSRTEFRYDARGRMIERTERPFSDDDPFNDTTTPKLVTRYFYDRDDRLVKVVGPRGGITVYSYDGLSRISEETDPLGNQRRYVYDIAGRSVEVEHRDIETDGTTIRSRKWKQKSDARGRLVETREPDGALTWFEYDDRDLLTAMVDRDGTRREYTYGPLNELLSDTLDPAGLNITNWRSYDLVGRLIATEDPSGQRATYQYDGIGRLVRSSLPGDQLPRMFSYGPDGRLTNSILPSGLSLSYTYDTAGRLATVNAGNIPDGVEAIPQHFYSYDPLGRLLSASAGSATVSRAYDSLGRLLRETTHGDTLEMVYNYLAGTAVRKWPDGRRETLSANLNGVVTSIERTASGTLGAGGSVLGAFTPYGIGLIGKASLLGGVETSYTYDERKRISRVRYAKGGTTLEETLYRYDKADRRRVEMTGTGTIQARLHLFDRHDRLKETCEGSQLVTLGTSGYTQGDHDADIEAMEYALSIQTPPPVKYEYSFLQLSSGKADERLSFKKTDAAGGVTTTAYSYTEGHRLASAGGETITHLPDGTRRSDANSRYEVDALGRVTKVKNPGGTATKTSVEYDPLGRVASITGAGGGVRKLSYFGGSLWQERGNSGPTRQFTHHPGMPGPMAVHVSGETYLMHHDARMNLAAVTDSAGTLRQRYRYEPFGAPSPATSSTGIEPRFGGLRWMNDAGLYLGGARMMDPRHGLWLSHDPLGTVDSPNLYAYAGQNPIDYADPSGLSAGKGSVASNGDGGTVAGGRGSGYFGPPRISMAGGTSKRSVAYGAGDGKGIEGPQWLMDTTEFLRNVSNRIRDGFASMVDSTLGQLGTVGKYLGGIAKRTFDFTLMFTPLGYAVFEEEATGMIGMYGMGVDAMYNPSRERYERLGNMIGAIPEYLAHASAEEWGSWTVDALPSIVSGGVTVWRTGGRSIGKIVGKISRHSANNIRGRLSMPRIYTEKFSVTGGYGSFEDYWLARNPQARIEALIDQYSLRKHLGGIEVIHGGSKVGVSGGVDPMNFKTIKIYDEGLSMGDRYFVETMIEEIHHSKLMGLYPETRRPSFNHQWDNIVEPRAKSYAKSYADEIFGGD